MYWNICIPHTSFTGAHIRNGAKSKTQAYFIQHSDYQLLFSFLNEQTYAHADVEADDGQKMKYQLHSPTKSTLSISNRKFCLSKMSRMVFCCFFFCRLLFVVVVLHSTSFSKMVNAIFVAPYTDRTNDTIYAFVWMYKRPGSIVAQEKK